MLSIFRWIWNIPKALCLHLRMTNLEIYQRKNSIVRMIRKMFLAIVTCKNYIQFVMSWISQKCFTLSTAWILLCTSLIKTTQGALSSCGSSKGVGKMDPSGMKQCCVIFCPVKFGCKKQAWPIGLAIKTRVLTRVLKLDLEINIDVVGFKSNGSFSSGVLSIDIPLRLIRSVRLNFVMQFFPVAPCVTQF